ncbi:MAG: phospho-sugar mutase [Firmicutes bacterium]|nr:phospho-sugar mutase [Bacillota bacterium]
MSIESSYERWLLSPRVDQTSKDELRKMSVEEKNDAFFKDVEFGTAGMRGLLGPGTNRMNVFTVRKATIGFAKYVIEKYPDARLRGVAISHDNRHMSRAFTLDIARTLNLFGIKAYIFDSLRPTPELSFAVRHLNAVGGIIITASHNPKEYNGYKVYDENGCQLVPYRIDRLVEIIASLKNELEVEVEHYRPYGKTITLGKEIDDEYIRLVEAIQINPQLDKKGFKIVFTPQHGTSYMPAMRIFKDTGYEVYPVLSQCDPDPDFSGTLSPNPEDKRAYIEPIKLAEKIGGNLIVMNDPDADRVGVAYLSSKGTYELFTGNESGALLIDYVLGQRKAKGLLSKNGILYNTIVTSSLGTAIAQSYGVKVQSLLTGFKFIGDQIALNEKIGGPHFEFGYEESYGCLIAPFCRDKDGLQAILLYCEMALFHFRHGKTLDQVMEELQQKFGYHYDCQFSIEFKGPEGAQLMSQLMVALREKPLDEILGRKVVRREDYLQSLAYENGKTEAIHLPKSDVMKIFLDDETTIAVRPSGTEPKCKFYYGAVGTDRTATKEKPAALHAALCQIYHLK